jgi:hypothetical protein
MTGQALEIRIADSEVSSVFCHYYAELMIRLRSNTRSSTRVNSMEGLPCPTWGTPTMGMSPLFLPFPRVWSCRWPSVKPNHPNLIGSPTHQGNPATPPSEQPQCLEPLKSLESDNLPTSLSGIHHGQVELIINGMRGNRQLRLLSTLVFPTLRIPDLDIEDLMRNWIWSM